MARCFLLWLLLFANVQAYSQSNPVIVPQPAYIQTFTGSFQLSTQTPVYFTQEGEKAATYLKQQLSTYYQINILPVQMNANENSNGIVLISQQQGNHPSNYSILSNSNNIILRGGPQGLFYGVQTLLQLIPLKALQMKENRAATFIIPSVSIKDSARFDYRGMHLDVSRHFFSVAYIKRYIDFLAFHKMNYFHWHLTDDQGWRIQINKYPLLTQTGACRQQTLVGAFGSNHYDGKKYCGFYTQDEIREIVQYASSRYITIIPEIEMPGHSLAALTSYPFLGCTKGPYEVMQTWGVSEDVICAGNDSSFLFLEGVLDEVVSLFPGDYIHIGGDECPKDRWKSCNRCQQRINQLHLAGEHGLQSYFINRIEQYLNKKGKKIIGWDEILEGGLAPNAVVMSWRDETGGIAAAKQQHQVIMSPQSPLYLNHSQSLLEDSVTQGGYNPIEKVYHYDPLPATLTNSEGVYILGAQGNLWSEYLNNEVKLEYMLFPRIGALAEALWTPLSQKNYNRFEENLPALLNRYYAMGIRPSRTFYDISPQVVPTGDGRITWKLSSRHNNKKILFKGPDGVSQRYISPVEIKEQGAYSAVLVENDGTVAGNWYTQYFHPNKATGKKIELTTPPSPNYASGGAFTLVDGVQNTRGMSKSVEFLGFSGSNLEAIIDLGEQQYIDSISIRIFIQPESWIYPPSNSVFEVSLDGQKYIPAGATFSAQASSIIRYGATCGRRVRFVKVNIQNYGIIPDGKPGSGNPAWLFADEIEIK